MALGDLTQGETNALHRVASGYEIDPHMWSGLSKRGFVEQRLGKRVLTGKGRLAIGWR
jgi:hypothetical protein